MASRVIQVLLEKGELEGVKTVYSSNVSTVATIISRAEIHKTKHVAYKANPGVYLLIGKEDSDTSTVYIGESDRVGDRILTHSKDDEKAFWTEVIFFTSNMDNDTVISKSHIKFIENQLYLMAKQSPNIKLTETQNTPQKPKISRIDEAMSEEFLDNILFILKALRYDLFIPTNTTKALNETLKETPIIDDSPIYKCKINGAVAHMKIISGKYVLLKDSTLVRAYREHAPQSFKDRRDDLIKRGFIEDRSDSPLLIALQDIPLNSSTAAVHLVCGGAGSSGPREWKHNGKLLRDIESQE